MANPQPNFFYLNFMFHNSYHKYDRKIIVSNLIKSVIETWKSMDVVIESDKEFVIAVAQTHGLGHCVMYWHSKSSVGYPGYCHIPLQNWNKLFCKNLQNGRKLSNFVKGAFIAFRVKECKFNAKFDKIFEIIIQKNLRIYLCIFLYNSS